MKNDNIERKCELTLFGTFFEIIKKGEAGGDKLRDALRGNLDSDSVDGALAYLIMQEELEETDYKKLAEIYDKAKPMAEMLRVLLVKGDD